MSNIANFFAGRSVFITGGAGFAGKQIIEKMLRSCTGIENIYVLVRPKRGKTSQERVGQLIKSPLFDRLKSEQPTFHRKIIGVAGDVTLPGMGISDADHSRISEKASVVVHAAASLNARDTMREAVKSNLIGTSTVVQFCKELKKPEAFVHMSTIASQSDEDTLKGYVGDPRISPKQLLTLLEILDDKEMAAITPSLIGKQPSTYAFTKKMAEFEIKETIGNIPCAILRPGGIGSSLMEPVEGWCDNTNAANAILSGIGLGLYTTIDCSGKTMIDNLPGDTFTNFTIACIWYTAVNKLGANSPLVYNLTAGIVDPVTVQEFITYMNNSISKYPISNRISNSICHPTQNRLRLKASTSLTKLRCRLLDAAALATGKKPSAVQSSQFYLKFAKEYKYYFNKTYTADGENVKIVREAMGLEDNKLFPIIDRNIDWQHFYNVSWLGMKKYVFKEPISDDELKSGPVALKSN